MHKEHVGSLDRRLLSYAIAGSTIVGTCSLAEAGIVYSGPLNISAVSNTYSPFDLDNDGNEDVVFIFGQDTGTSPIGFGVAVRPLDLNVVPGGTSRAGIIVDGTITTPAKDAAANLSSGFTIGDTLTSHSWNSSTPNFGASAKIQNWNPNNGQPFEGNFAGALDKFIGFRLHLSSNEDLVYGWVRVSVVANLNDYPANGDVIIHDWAYQSTPDTPIIAGNVPEPTSLAIFALGGAGVAAWKRRRKAAAQV